MTKLHALTLARTGESPVEILARMESLLCGVRAPTLVRFWDLSGRLLGSALVSDGSVSLIQGVPGQRNLGHRLAERFPELRARIAEAVGRARRDQRLFGEVLTELGVSTNAIREELDAQLHERLRTLVSLGVQGGLAVSRHPLGAVAPPTRFRPVPVTDLVARVADDLGAPIELTDEVTRQTGPALTLTAAPPSRRAMLLEVLRLYAMAGEAGCLVCGTASGAVEIWVDRGCVVQAKAGAFRGAAALEHAATQGLGSFSWAPGLPPSTGLSLPIDELAALWSAAA